MKKIIEVKNISKVFGAGSTKVTAVSDVSFTVEEGNIILIMGPSGSGKTTLLTLLGALSKPTTGRIIINNIDITMLNEKELPFIRRENIGFIFQNFNLLESLTALENVELAAQLADKRGFEMKLQAESILVDLGLADRLHFKPAKLSGGERQRVAIARALVTDPALILADEPTGNLDSQSGRHVMMLLLNAVRERKKTAIIVSHDQRIRDIADYVFWIEDGKISAKAKPVHEVIDPICGMHMNIDDVESKLVYKGSTVYFCSSECKEKFEKTHKL